MNCVACGAPHLPAEVSCSYCLTAVPRDTPAGPTWASYFYGEMRRVDNPRPPPERTFAERADAFLSALPGPPNTRFK